MYSFSYTAALNGFMRLAEVQQFGRTSHDSLPATTFEYYDQKEDGETGSMQWDDEALYWQASHEHDGSFIDGMINGFSVFEDMNGDGLPDHVVSSKDSKKLYVYYNTGSAFKYIEGKSEWNEPYPDFLCSTDACYGRINVYHVFDNIYHQNAFLMDMNGDALPDRVMVAKGPSDQQARYLIAFNNGLRFQGAAVWLDPYIGNFAGTSDQDKGFIDMNGDGLVDRVVGDKAHHQFKVYFNTGKGFKDQAVIWNDPLFSQDTNYPGIGQIFGGSGDKIESFMRDMNSDGLPDRVWRVNLKSKTADGTLADVGVGFHVALNLNGLGWAESIIDSSTNLMTFNGVDSLAILDPIEDTNHQGYLSKQADWIDFNGDGYLDRVYGDPAAKTFTVYTYQGRSTVESYSKLTSKQVFADPLTDEEGEEKAAGLIYNKKGKNDLHTMIRDLNGDGYPDRISITPRNSTANTKHFKIYPLRMNALTFSDIPAPQFDQKVNQPINLLKKVSNGLGDYTAIEYIPTTRSVEWNGDIPVRIHRHLPFNLNVARKIYKRDPSIDINQSLTNEVESLRHPGSRYETISYQGGHLYVRHAKDNVSYQKAFHGFQTVERIKKPTANDTWKTMRTITRYHQALGDVGMVTAEESPRFVPDGYQHLSLAGRQFHEIKWLGNKVMSHDEIDWEVNSQGDSSFLCQGRCFPRLKTKKGAIYDLVNDQKRVSRVEFDYDLETGQVLKESHFGKNNELILETVNEYFSKGSFSQAPLVTTRLQAQRQQKNEKVYRSKSFEYNDQADPIKEHYHQDANNQMTIERQFTGGHLSYVKNLDGLQKEYVYDDKGLFPLQEKVLLNQDKKLVTKRTYNRFNGNTLTEESPSGLRKRSVYDDFGRVLEEYAQDKLGDERLTARYQYEFVYDTLDNDVVNRAVLKTTAWFPQIGYSVTETEPATITYSAIDGQVYQKCSRMPNGNFQKIYQRVENGGFDEYQTEPMESSDCSFDNPVPSTLRKYYTRRDQLGRVIEKEPPLGDDNGKSPMGKIQYQYETLANNTYQKKTIFPNGTTTTEVLNEQGRLDKVIDTNGNTIEYSYSPVGELEQVKLDGTVMTEIGYDQLGRKIWTEDKNLGHWTYSYNVKGQLTEQKDNKLQRTTYQYDEAGRVTQKSVYQPNSETAESYELYTYDSGESHYDVQNGELFKVSEYDTNDQLLRETKYGYENRFRKPSLISRTLVGLGTLNQEMTYDTTGRITKTIYPTGESVYLKYNRAGQVNQICGDHNCQPGALYYEIKDTDYTVYGSLTKEYFGNGVVSEYDYYPQTLRPKSKKVFKGDQVYSYKTYEYDVSANIKKIVDELNQKGTGAIQNATYDTSNRLTGFQYQGTNQLHSLEYDHYGNILKNTSSFGDKLYEYTSNKPHAVTKIGDKEFTYDDNGNMLTDGDRVMHYNARNELVKVEMKNATVVEYAYDYTTARVSKTVTKKDPMGKIHTATTYFLGKALEIKGENILMHLNQGDRRILTKSLGKFSDLGTASAGFRPSYIELEPKPLTWMPFLLLIATLFMIASMRPLGICIPRWIIREPLTYSLRRQPTYLRLWYLFLHGYKGYTTTIHQAIFHLYRKPAYKLISLALVACFVIQYPLNVMAGDTGQPTTQISDENFMFYHHADHLGSSNIITEGKESGLHSGVTYKQGDLLQRFEYEPFGKEKYVLNPNLKIDPSYTGQIYDIETGLYYYKARYYNPELGRFIQADTIVPDAKNLQAHNRYAYVINNPFKYTDPSGHGFWGWFKKLFAVFIGALIGALVTFLTAGTMAGAYTIAAIKAASLGFTQGLLAGVIGGVVGGAVSGAITGGVKGALFGALFGGLSALAGGIANHGLFKMGVTNLWHRVAMLGVVGATVSYGTGGWQGLATFGAGMAGSLIGAGLTGGLKKGADASESKQVNPNHKLNGVDTSEIRKAAEMPETKISNTAQAKSVSATTANSMTSTDFPEYVDHVNPLTHAEAVNMTPIAPESTEPLGWISEYQNGSTSNAIPFKYRLLAIGAFLGSVENGALLINAGVPLLGKGVAGTVAGLIVIGVGVSIIAIGGVAASDGMGLSNITGVNN